MPEPFRHRHTRRPDAPPTPPRVPAPPGEHRGLAQLIEDRSTAVNRRRVGRISPGFRLLIALVVMLLLALVSTALAV